MQIESIISNNHKSRCVLFFRINEFINFLIWAVGKGVTLELKTGEAFANEGCYHLEYNVAMEQTFDLLNKRGIQFHSEG